MSSKRRVLLSLATTGNRLLGSIVLRREEPSTTTEIPLDLQTFDSEEEASLAAAQAAAALGLDRFSIRREWRR